MACGFLSTTCRHARHHPHARLRPITKVALWKGQWIEVLGPVRYRPQPEFSASGPGPFQKRKRGYVGDPTSYRFIVGRPPRIVSFSSPVFMRNEGKFVSTKVEWKSKGRTKCLERRGFRFRTTDPSVFPGTYRANADRESSQQDSESASTRPPTASYPRIVRPCSKE